MTSESYLKLGDSSKVLLQFVALMRYWYAAQIFTVMRY